MSTDLEAIEAVSAALDNYAQRGVFRGLSQGEKTRNGIVYRILWHHDRHFELTFDPRKKTLRFACVLPSVDPKSAMYRAFREFLKAARSSDLPEHRRIDEGRATLKPYNRTGTIALTLRVLDDDFEYGTQKLIHFVHDVYLTFLYDPLYTEYLVEIFHLDPDHV